MIKIYFAILFLLNITSSFAYLNFFLHSNESLSLLGTSGQLFYIFEGKLRTNVLQQRLNITWDKDDLKYNWRSFKDELYYYISIEKSDANLQTNLSIPLNGLTPTKISKFQIDLNCDSIIYPIEMYPINLSINIEFLLNDDPNKSLKLVMHYTKYCKAKSYADILQYRAKTMTQIHKNNFLVAYICIAILVGSLIILIVSLSVTRWIKKCESGVKRHVSIEKLNYNQIPHIPIKSLSTMSKPLKSAKSSQANIYEALKDLTVISQANQTVTNNKTICLLNDDDQEVDDGFNFKHDQVELDKVILEGTFSRIYEGKLRKKSDDNKEDIVRVMVKTVNERASTQQIELMLREGKRFKNLKHKHLSSLIGVCTHPNKYPLLLFTHCSNGNLKLYLKMYKNELKTQELLYLILQLTKGLHYLHSKSIIHKDIAARNCWLERDLFIKLADDALARDIFPDDYHCLGDNENRPIMWLALESIKHNVFNASTDLWQLGVTAWEIFSFGAQPYQQQDPFEMSSHLQNPLNRLVKPAHCPDDIYNVYSNCWLVEPVERPTLKTLFHALLDLYSKLGNFI